MAKGLTRYSGMTDLSASAQWDVVFPDGGVWKSGRSGQMAHISPKTDGVVAWFSSTHKSTLWVHAYAREVAKQMCGKGTFDLEKGRLDNAPKTYSDITTGCDFNCYDCIDGFVI